LCNKRERFSTSTSALDSLVTRERQIAVAHALRLARRQLTATQRGHSVDPDKKERRARSTAHSPFNYLLDIDTRSAARIDYGTM
jgi:hypothetical protein